MRIDRRILNWGIFFVLLGAVPLVWQAGIVDRDLVARSWQLWPLLVIAAGVGLVLRRTSFGFAGGVIAAGTFGVMLGGLLVVGPDFAALGRGCGAANGRTFPAQAGSVTNGTVTVEFNCG